MHYSQESLASWATILGSIVSLLALIQSQTWLVVTSAFFICVAISSGLYARRERLALNAASIKIEGHSIDSLNIANLRRLVNRSLVVQEAHHEARIEGEDLKITWRYSGYCRAAQVSTIEFSIDSDNSTPFDRLDCFAYDLDHDPGAHHRILPILLSPDGLSKKISVPFLEPVAADQPFNVLLRCTLPGCIKAGFGYYTSTLSLAQERVRRCTTRLSFVNPRPEWLRVYACDDSGRTFLLKSLSPAPQIAGVTEYFDSAENVQGRSARIYVFVRPLDLLDDVK